MSVVSTYAEALYEAAVEQDAVAPVAADLEAFRGALAEFPDLRAVLVNPEIETEQKKAALAALTGDAHPLLRNFLQVLLDRRREDVFEDIASAFAERVARAEGRLRIEAITAVPLPADLRQAVVERVAAQTHHEVDLTERIDPSIVGGLVLRAGGLLVDASVRHQLDELERSLASAPVETTS
jgi:F-type H+-transporting ATPase subunit delta